jgi:general stress protein 26
MMDMNATSTTAEQREHFHKLLSQFHTAMLVTHEKEGRLRARPMAIAGLEEDCRMWFIMGTNSAKEREIEADARVHIVCQNDRSAYISMSGRAELVNDRAKIEELWKEPFRVWFPGGKHDQGIELIMVRPEEGEFWDNEGFNKIKYIFGAAKAYVTGTTPSVDEGDQHGRVRL